jgi:hypothetical protein
LPNQVTSSFGFSEFGGNVFSGQAIGLTFNVGGGAPIGTFSVAITGLGLDGAQHTTMLSLTIQHTPHPLPPISLMQFDPQALLGQLMAGAGPEQGTTGLLLTGHGAESGFESAAAPQPGFPGPSQDPIFDAFYNYRLAGVAQDIITSAAAGAPASFTINFGVSGHVQTTFLEVSGSLSADRVNTKMTSQGSLSGTWTKDARGTTLIHIDTFTTDTAIHQTESVSQGPVAAGTMPQVWALDATIHTTGQGDEELVSRANQTIVFSTVSATDQINASLSPSTDSHELTRIGFSFQRIDMSQTFGNEAFQDDWASSGTGSGTITPPSGRPHAITALVHAGGSTVGHVIPTVVLYAPVALAPQGFVSTTTPTFSWTAVSGATHYSFTLIDLTTPTVLFGDSTTNSWTPSVGLKPGDSYVWYVQALDNDGDASGFSNNLEFAVNFGTT